MPNKQHTMHGRDHEHGAADPTLIHWADTDTGGGGGGGGWGHGRFIAAQSGSGHSALASGVNYQVDFTSGIVNSNDLTPYSITTRTSPFTGDNFSFDWASNSHRIAINTPGVYLVHYIMELQFSAPPAQPFEMEIRENGTFPAGGPWYTGIGGVYQTAAMRNTDTAYTMTETVLYVVPSFTTWYVGMMVQQQSGATTLGTGYGMTVLRLGDLD